MKSFENEKFLSPEAKYRVKPMMHSFCVKDDIDALPKVLTAFGYGGAVINPEYNKETFVNEECLKTFEKVTESFKKAGLEYWVYDECGYPSGIAAGLSVKDHRDLEAKGIYMVRRIAYEPRHSTFTIDDETDKIVWAAKYPFDTPRMSQALVRYKDMIPVPFTDTFCECDLQQNEAFFIFCQKSAFEGSHLTHNVSGVLRYINVMDKKAVRRFIDIAYEPIAKHSNKPYENAFGVFTDEPSLQVGYCAGYENWPYALLPYCDELFDRYEQEHGSSLLPYLPLLFENGDGAAPIRINFYRLVAKLISEAYSGQLSKWCREHKTLFSGHYYGEESLSAHVNSYGDIVPVIMAADYPGIDILECTPEYYNCNTAKHVQMVARKKGTNGMMVELCPHINKEQFALDPWNNMSVIVSHLAMSGVRKFNSYFRADLKEIDQRIDYGVGYKSQEDCIKFNEYVGRICYMLDNLQSDCNVYVYRAIEDVQAKNIPRHSAAYVNVLGGADGVTTQVTQNRLFPMGVDFQYVDVDDLCKAVDSIKNGKPTVSGCEIKLLIIPAVDYVDSRAQKAMVELKNAGVTVLFCNKLPKFGTDLEHNIDLNEHFEPINIDKLADFVSEIECDFRPQAEGVRLHTAKYIKDGKEMYFIINNTRGIDANLILNHKFKQTATVYNPIDGKFKKIVLGESYTIPAFRGVFVVFD